MQALFPLHRPVERNFHIKSRGDRTRTCDVLPPKQARYQLRHAPKSYNIIPYREVAPNLKRRDEVSCLPGDGKLFVGVDDQDLYGAVRRGDKPVFRPALILFFIQL